jgi:hypothetical protein
VLSTSEAILELLQAFRDDSEATVAADSDSISLGSLRHVLCEVATPSSLSVQETTDLFRMTGLLPMSLPPAKAKRAILSLPSDTNDARKRAARDGSAKASLTTVDPAELLQLLCFRQGPLGDDGRADAAAPRM